MLGVFTVGNLIQEYSLTGKYLCGIIGIILLILLLAKILKYTEDVVKDLKNPVIASVSATFLMSLIILSSILHHLV